MEELLLPLSAFLFDAVLPAAQAFALLPESFRMPLLSFRFLACLFALLFKSVYMLLHFRTVFLKEYGGCLQRFLVGCSYIALAAERLQGQCMLLTLLRQAHPFLHQIVQEVIPLALRLAQLPREPRKRRIDRSEPFGVEGARLQSAEECGGFLQACRRDDDTYAAGFRKEECL